MHKKKLRTLCLIVLSLVLCGCARSNILAQYDTEGIAYMAYSDIDTVCENPELTEAGQKLLSSLEDQILLSFIVDSSVQITEELGPYDYLVITNLSWIQRFGDPEKLKPLESDSISKDMRDFLDEQMALLMADGSQWSESDKIHLYQYENGKLLSFPVNVTLGAAEPVEAKNPLIILVEEPAETLKADACMLPLASSGNVLFEDADKIREALETSPLKEYCKVEKLEQS